MEIKKSPKADLQNRKGIYLEIGFILSLVLCIVAFSDIFCYSAYFNSVNQLFFFYSHNIHRHLACNKFYPALLCL